jgi:hypothetical protein
LRIRKAERKRPIERHGCKWENNIKVDLKEIGGVRLKNGFIWLKIGARGTLL